MGQQHFPTCASTTLQSFMYANSPFLLPRQKEKKIYNSNMQNHTIFTHTFEGENLFFHKKIPLALFFKVVLADFYFNCKIFSMNENLIFFSTHFVCKQHVACCAATLKPQFNGGEIFFSQLLA